MNIECADAACFFERDGSSVQCNTGENIPLTIGCDVPISQLVYTKNTFLCVDVHPRTQMRRIQSVPADVCHLSILESECYSELHDSFLIDPDICYKALSLFSETIVNEVEKMKLINNQFVEEAIKAERETRFVCERFAQRYMLNLPGPLQVRMFIARTTATKDSCIVDRIADVMGLDITRFDLDYEFASWRNVVIFIRNNLHYLPDGLALYFPSAGQVWRIDSKGNLTSQTTYDHFYEQFQGERGVPTLWCQGYRRWKEMKFSAFFCRPLPFLIEDPMLPQCFSECPVVKLSILFKKIIDLPSLCFYVRGEELSGRKPQKCKEHRRLTKSFSFADV